MHRGVWGVSCMDTACLWVEWYECGDFICNIFFFIRKMVAVRMLGPYELRDREQKRVAFAYVNMSHDAKIIY